MKSEENKKNSHIEAIYNSIDDLKTILDSTMLGKLKSKIGECFFIKIEKKCMDNINKRFGDSQTLTQLNLNELQSTAKSTPIRDSKLSESKKRTFSE